MRRAPAIARGLPPQARRIGDVDIELLDGAEIDDAVAIAVQRRELARGLNHRFECLASQGARASPAGPCGSCRRTFRRALPRYIGDSPNAGAGDCRSDRIL
jgi:hypothetical protein